MSTSLIEQIEEYFDQIEAQQLPVTADEVDARLGSVTATQPTRGLNRRGLLVAAATAVLVLLAGIIPLLFAGDETPTADTLDTTPNSTIAPPTTNPAPSTTVPADVGFAPRLEGSGVEVTFGVTPVDMEIADRSFVLIEAEWSIDWESVAWEWGDDEIRQRIALGSSLGGNYVFRSPNTLIFVDDVQNSFADPFERFTLSFAGTAEDFAIDVSKESSGEHVASVTGSLPGLDEDQILRRVANARMGPWEPSRAGWFFAAGNGELTPLDPPWQPFWGAGYFEPDPFFEVGDFTLALFTDDFELDRSNLWRTTDGHVWEDLGEPSWPDLAGGSEVFVHEDRLYEDGWTRDEQGYFQELEFWTSTDGVEWTELTQAEYEAATGLTVSTANPDDLPPPPDPWLPPDLDRAAIEAHFEELAQNATVISEDPLILQLLPGPEPRFDTSDLGDEIPFEPLTPDDARAGWLVQMIAEGADDPGPQPDGPVLFVGHVTDETIALPYDEIGRLAGWRMLWASECGFECLGVEGLQAAGELAGDIWTDRNPGLLIAVPTDTAIVAVRYNAGAALWQRPTGSWAIFPLSIDGDDTYWIDAYDVDGNLIATTEQR